MPCLSLRRPPLKSARAGSKHGSILSGNFSFARVSSGRKSTLTRIAWETAFALNQTTISRALLAAAVDRWAIPLGLCRHNPFREGARDYELVMQDWKQNPIREDL
jgi:hypothetical protein